MNAQELLMLIGEETLVPLLKDQLEGLEHALKYGVPCGMFHTNPVKDRKAIKKMIKHLKKVIKYNEVPQ